MLRVTGTAVQLLERNSRTLASLLEFSLMDVLPA
jgi:hypothetical protein